MKILFFIGNLYSGGKERRLVELLKGISKYDDISMELVLTRRDIHYTDIFNLDIKIHYIERKHLKKDPSLFFKFYQIARKFKPDIIHVWENMVAFYAIPSKLLLRIPMINNQITGAPLHVSRGLLSHKVTFPFSDIIIANSREGLKSYNVPERKSAVIYSGFDFNRIADLRSARAIREMLSINTRYIIGMVASFSTLKDYDTYIEAAQKVLYRNSDVTFLCVGAGDARPYQKLVQPEFSNRIRFLGKQQKIESIMNICDIGVLATYTEGIANSVMEFMALSKPLVVTAGGGTKELVIDKKTGLLVKQQSPIDMAEKINYLLDNKEIALHMGLKAKKRIEKYFNMEQMTNAFRKIYNNLV